MKITKYEQKMKRTKPRWRVASSLKYHNTYFNLFIIYNFTHSAVFAYSLPFCIFKFSTNAQSALSIGQ